MNRRNPGLVEPETMSKEEEHRFYLYYALGWTFAAAIFTAFKFWEGHTTHAGFSWFMAVGAWGCWWYEERKAGRGSLSKKRQSVKEDGTRG